MADLDEERYYGNHEYKLKLVNSSGDRVLHLSTQMKFRMQEGNGEAFYEIGVKDNGEAYGLDQHEMETSLCIIYRMAHSLKAELTLLNIKKGKCGEIAQLMVRQNVSLKHKTSKSECSDL